ncbi:hypothetical protein PYCCODRAFT_1472783 [Trametes coccinea BRFM310]|uniref:SH3 domain-containing protein n=1 Tax=Trametes coccinea (strain BRFM310) TaxID=1353009 RepID=A0A1Y2I527_TRAC3|nr:hypothetical protein PYCCODRAFT_1472783 [Trametes coccinea BRFM310]
MRDATTDSEGDVSLLPGAREASLKARLHSGAVQLDNPPCYRTTRIIPCPLPRSALRLPFAPSPSPSRSPEDRPSPRLGRVLNPATGYFETKFQTDYVSEDQLRRHPPLQRRLTPTSVPQARAGAADEEWEPGSPFNNLPPFSQARSSMTGGAGAASDATSHRRAFSAYAPSSVGSRGGGTENRNPFETYGTEDDGLGFDDDLLGGSSSVRKSSMGGGSGAKPKLAPKAELTRPLLPHEGVARAIALFDFNAVQPGDLSFKKGQVITVTEKSEDTNTWWKGKVDGREGVFPANFVEVV